MTSDWTQTDFNIEYEEEGRSPQEGGGGVVRTSCTLPLDLSLSFMGKVDFYSPLDGMRVHHRAYPISIKFADSFLPAKHFIILLRNISWLKVNISISIILLYLIFILNCLSQVSIIRTIIIIIITIISISIFIKLLLCIII